MLKRAFALRVLAVTFLLIALPLIIDSFIFFQRAYEHTIDEAKLGLKEDANFRAFALAQLQPVNKVLLLELEYLLKLKDKIAHPNKAELNHSLEEAARISKGIKIIILVPSETSGKYEVLAASDPSFFHFNFISFIALKDVLDTKKGTFIRNLYSPVSNQYELYSFAAHGIEDRKSNKKAILLIATPIREQLQTILSSTPKNGKPCFAVLSRDGIVFASTDPKLNGNYFKPINEERKQEILESGQLGNVNLNDTPLPTFFSEKEAPFFQFAYDNHVQIAYPIYISEMDLWLVAFAPKEEFFTQVVGTFLFIYLLYGAILLLGGAIAFWAAQWISRPLRKLSYLMGQVSEGNLNVRFTPEPFGYEINMLGELFNTTLNQLLKNIQTAEDERVKKETYQKELNIGRQVQKSLIPIKWPEVQGVSIAGIYMPAEDVGGDFFGIMRKKIEEEEVLTIAVADAAGRGISSCLYALSARSLIFAYSDLYHDIGKILQKVNHNFMEDTGDTGMFITLILGNFSVRTKRLDYFSCGHVPAIVRKADGQLITLAHSGMALGLVDTSDYKTDSIVLEKGDVVLFYTDGLIEASNSKNQHFSERRVKNCLQRRPWISAKEVVNGLSAELKEFIGSAPQEEEIIIVVLECN